MNNINQVIEEVKRDIEQEVYPYYLVPNVNTLLSGLEEAQREIEFWQREVEGIRIDKAVLKEALEWIVECGTDYQSINKARTALSFLSEEESQ